VSSWYLLWLAASGHSTTDGCSTTTDRWLRWLALGSLGMAERPADRVRELRARTPHAVAEAAQRRQRPLPQEDGKLFLIAADHPARGALSVGDRPLAMADRNVLLERLCVALDRPGVDGVLATPDIIEDLLLLGVLDAKVVVGSMNRGGIRGSVFELDDRFTAYDVPAIVSMGFEGGKMLCRIAPDDPRTAGTLQACGRAVTELASHGLVAMIEPFWANHARPGHAHNEYATDLVIRSVTITSALGATSAYTWLKLPMVKDMEQVVAATTLPVVLLGGDGAAQEETLAAFETALGLPGVRGVAAGRTMLYPDDDDVARAVDEVVRLLGRKAARTEERRTERTIQRRGSCRPPSPACLPGGSTRAGATSRSSDA
jgi:hypothetical protein